MHMYDLGSDFYKLMEKYTDANRLVRKLEKQGEILLFGGAVRSYKDNRFEEIPRDFDMVIRKNDNNLDIGSIIADFHYIKNRFGGYKLRLDSLEFDIWEIENTWAFREEKLLCKEYEYTERLQDTVFLNLDSIVYNLTKREIYDEKYELAMKSKILDVVLEDNPCIALNIIRAILFKQKYDMEFSEHLRNIISEFSNRSDYLNILYRTQIEHYSLEVIDRKNLKICIDSCRDI